MGMPAARLGDMHVCPMVTGIVPHVGGPILPACAPTVLTGSMPQARIGDMLVCVGPPDIIVLGAFTVLAMGAPAARMFDMTAHGGVIMLGFPTVLIGDSGGGGGGGGGGGAAQADKVGGSGGKSGTMTKPDMVMNASTAFSQPEAQAKTLKQAAADGSPFCDRCA